MWNKNQIATWAVVSGLTLGLGVGTWQCVALRHRISQLEAEISG
jgi:hypothetical protein